jgi:hypothetical protein
MATPRAKACKSAKRDGGTLARRRVPTLAGMAHERLIYRRGDPQKLDTIDWPVGVVVRLHSRDPRVLPFPLPFVVANLKGTIAELKLAPDFAGDGGSCGNAGSSGSGISSRNANAEEGAQILRRFVAACPNDADYHAAVVIDDNALFFMPAPAGYAFNTHPHSRAGGFNSGHIDEVWVIDHLTAPKPIGPAAFAPRGHGDPSAAPAAHAPAASPRLRNVSEPLVGSTGRAQRRPFASASAAQAQTQTPAVPPHPTPPARSRTTACATNDGHIKTPFGVAALAALRPSGGQSPASVVARSRMLQAFGSASPTSL